VSLPTAVCIAGPTATGKTALALHLADRLPAEIISVDSAMVYRGLDIGTAKPSPDVRRSVPHHLIDIRDPWQSYSAGAFARDALALIEAIHAAGRVPLLVGGTLLYFRSLMRGLAPLPAADPGVRARLDARAAAEGWPALHAELARVDPDAAGRIAPNDRQRIQRALEVHALTGRPISTWQREPAVTPQVDFTCIALLLSDRGALHARIAERFDEMLAQGLLDEVRSLRALPGMHGDLPSMRSVGYRQFWRYLDAACTLDEATRDAVTATRRYAKRQLTWLRSEPEFLPVDAHGPRLANRVLNRLGAAGILDAISKASR
jgi:tRNA dimethylallyltransferase